MNQQLCLSCLRLLAAAEFLDAPVRFRIQLSNLLIISVADRDVSVPELQQPVPQLLVERVVIDSVQVLLACK